MNMDTKYAEDLVSIITPVFNCEKFIGECIESVLSQTYKKWELIIVDDNSSDRTISIIKYYAEKDSRIKIYTQSQNLGAAASRNLAIKMSNGRFIAFLDSDDKWKADKLYKQTDFMLKNKYGFTFTSYEIIKDMNATRVRVFHVPQKINYEQYLKNTIIGCLTVMLDKQIIRDIEFEIGHLEDVLTWMKFLKKGHIAYGLDENLAEYRIVKNSASSNKLKNAMRYYKCLRERQNLSFYKSAYFQIGYMFNATWKRLF